MKAVEISLTIGFYLFNVFLIMYFNTNKERLFDELIFMTLLYWGITIYMNQVLYRTKVTISSNNNGPLKIKEEK